MSSQVEIQGLKIGGGAPVRIESMLKIPLSDVSGCLAQCERIVACGCEIARVALPDKEQADALGTLAKKTSLRLMADVHFDPDIAIAAMRAGIRSVRINPGNMSKIKLVEMIKVAKDMGVVIRIGANGGSLGNHQPDLFFAVEEQLNLLLENGFDKDIILSAKSSGLAETVRANALISRKYNFPLHIGITEAGFGIEGIAKGASGISLMLAQGIGDTLRVSLTDEPETEVRTGYAILNALEMRKRGATLISCPTCGRRRVDVCELVRLVEPLLKDLPDGMTVAVMGCEVNGPREAKHADFGIAGTPNGVVIFKLGEIVGSFPIEKLEKIPELLQEIANNLSENLA